MLFAKFGIDFEMELCYKLLYKRISFLALTRLAYKAEWNE